MVRGRVITEIQKRFSQEGIEIPIPQQDIHIRSINQAGSEIKPG
jgi:small-conductance mechanosensitive channel